jgi:hypothetical protein
MLKVVELIDAVLVMAILAQVGVSWRAIVVLSLELAPDLTGKASEH